MKKWGVLVVIAFLGLMLGLQYLNKRNEVKPAGQGALPLPGESAGVSLPPEATGYAQDYPRVPSSDPGASAAPGAFTAMTGVETSSGACSLNDIMAAHGTTWGYEAQGEANIFDTAVTEKMYEALINYFSCKAVATDDMTACDALPAGVAPANKGYSHSPSPRGACVHDANLVLFSAYTTGKYNNISACVRYVSWLESVGAPHIDPSDFCPVVAKGMDKFCDMVPVERAKKGCRGAFPAKKSDCSGEGIEDCLNRYSRYQAIKAGNPGQCPVRDRASCEALFSGTLAPCARLATAAGKLYCSHLPKPKIDKEAEFQALQKKRDVERFEQQQKEEQKKALQEVNKKVRKAMGRE